jgi:quercetin dioxygenase-like cupin family protein
MISTTIERKELLKTTLANSHVTAADVREVTLAPGQKTGRHVHPCTVLGYILEGTALLQIEGGAVETLHAGSAFHEPAGAVIAAFSNASLDRPLRFVAFYLLDGRQDLIVLIGDS